jgi:two-component system, response regulator YesN
MYKMLVVDDEYLVRMGIRETIDWGNYDIEIIGEADNGKSGLKMALELKPDLILSDIKMPVMDGLEFVKQLLDHKLDCTVVILSGYKDFDYAKGTLEKGAYSYLLKPIDNDELITTVVEALEQLKQKRETKDYYQRLEDQLPSLKENLVDKLIHEKDNDYKDIQKNLMLYGITIPKNGFLVYVQMDETVGLKKEEVKRILHSINQLINSKFKCDAEENITFYEDTAFVMLVNEGETNESVLQKCEEAVKHFEKKHSEIISVCVSDSYHSLKEIHNLYEVAKETISNKLFPMINSVVLANKEEEKYKPQVIEVMKFIAENYHQNITIKTVADTLYISESYLMHMFKDNVGKTFNEVLTEYRIMIAKKLLLTNQYKVYEIAEMVGYNDVKYFSQVFRKKEGLSPSQFVNSQE